MQSAFAGNSDAMPLTIDSIITMLRLVLIGPHLLLSFVGKLTESFYSVFHISEQMFVNWNWLSKRRMVLSFALQLFWRLLFHLLAHWQAAVKPRM
jgi:hypothetical protein